MGTVDSRRVVSRSAAGGAAGEAGSEYRAGVGAYLAAHGLTGTPIGLIDDATAGYPIEIAVEADEAVDDIECRLSDSSRIFIQTKRKFGLDRQLKAAISQWIEAMQLGQLAPGDLLVVVGSEVSGPALRLASALERRRRRTAQVPSRREQDVLEWFTEAVRNSLSAEQFDELIERTRIVQAPLESSASSLHRESARLLEGTVVPLGSGATAISALAVDIRRQGARRYGSTIDDWLSVLAQASVPVLNDIDGALGARRLAVLTAIENYAEKHSKTLDQIRLSRLLFDVPALRIENFFDGFDVHVELSAEDTRERDRSVKLVHVVKRWRRLCLVGLPGSGKSTALEQLAATWASEPGSPTPIKVSLRSLAELCADRIDIPSPGEIVAAADFVDRLAGRPVADELLSRLAVGTAGLLLDGLDECGAELGSVIDAIEHLIASCHSECPVILTTRASAATAVERLRLPVATLAEPKNLDSNIESLIEHLGRHRMRVNVDDPWVLQRKSWVKQSKAQDEILWKVPLLATLAAILVCDESRPTLPSNRTDVLYGAVSASIKDWEGGKKRHPERYHWTAHLTAEQLLDAFVYIGHELMDARTSEDEILGALRQHFEREWGQSRRDAQQTAVEAVRFWDELAGIYIVDSSARSISARTRLFAELGDALWATAQQDASIKSDWLKRRASQVGQGEPIKLAAQIDRKFADQLICHAVNGKNWNEIRLALSILDTNAEVEEESLRLLIEGLNEARSLEASSSTSGDDETGLNFNYLQRVFPRYDDSAWGWTVALCQLRLPPALRDIRLASLERLEQEEQLLAHALTCITNAVAENRPLSDSEAVSVRAVFAVDIPPDPDEPLVTTSRRSISFNSGAPLKHGHGEFAVGAAKLLKNLTANEAEYLDEISERCGMELSIKIKSVLDARGFRSKVTRWSLAKTVDFEKFSRRMDNEWMELTSIISSLDATLESADLSLIEAWSLPDYAAVVDVLGVGKSHGRYLGGALRQRESFRRLISLYVHHYGIDSAKAAVQARVAQPLITDFRCDIALMMYCPRPQNTEQKLRTARLSPQTHKFLVHLLCKGSAYLAELAARLIDNTSCVEALKLLPTDLSAIKVSRRYLVAALLLWMCPSERSVRTEAWLASDDPILRRAGCIQRVNTLVEQRRRSLDEITDSIRDLLRDSDWSIRVTAYRTLKKRSVEVAKPTLDQCYFWSCYECGERNVIADADCVHCSRGSRINA